MGEAEFEHVLDAGPEHEVVEQPTSGRRSERLVVERIEFGCDGRGVDRGTNVTPLRSDVRRLYCAGLLLVAARRARNRKGAG